MGRIAKHNPDERNHMAIMEIYYKAGKEGREGGRKGRKGERKGRREKEIRKRGSKM